MTVRSIPETFIPDGGAVPCPHCLAGIAAEAFEYPYWTAAQRTMIVWCPSCHLRVSISARDWRRSTGLRDLETA
jgi:hypothetical protein